jgi:prepilin-type N-terminal cleavage/methylation domain-containing protein
MRRYTKKTLGFTLIELMIAVAVFSVGIAASLEAISLSNLLTIEAKERTIALHDARSVLERIKITDLALLPKNQTATAASLWTDLPSFVSNSLVNETIRVTGSNDATLRTMSVCVTWSGHQKRVKMVEVSTLKSSFNG